MESDIELGVTTMFRDATMQSATLELRKPQDWDLFNAIKAEADARERAEVQSYAENRPQLIDAARQEIMRQAGAHRLEPKPPIGTDRFANIGQRAEKQVERAHQGRLITIRTDAAEAFDALATDICAREQVRGQAQRTFTRAADRRTPRQSHD